MLRHALLPAALGLSLLTPAQAADSWGLEHEQPTELTGTVVDLLCELAGDCAPNCGDGSRQLGILAADGRLVPVAKGTVFFAGAVPDLLPLCGRTVHADGLLLANPAMTVYFARYQKPAADAAWMPTDAYLAQWVGRNGEADEWWRADAAVEARVAEQGVLGVPGLQPE